MRTVIGWMAALFASALLGAAVYQTVLSTPLPELDPTATVETIRREPSPGPTLYRTEVRTIVEPTPTVTVEDVVRVADEAAPVSRPRTANPAPTRTSAPKSTPRATAEREDDSAERDDDSEDESDDEAHDDGPEDDDSGNGSDDD